LSKFDELKNVLLFLVLGGTLVFSNSIFFKASAAPFEFTHGVASGDVTSTSAVLWTRTDESAKINLEITSRDSFDPPDFMYSTTTTGANDFTAKITATNLKPNTPYHYRWIAGNSSSEVGMFITAPLDDQAADVHFSWSGDTDPSRNGSNYYFGHWNAFQSALSERPQFFIYLGDSIYSDLRGNNGTDQLFPKVNTLSEFRNLYKDARDVTALHKLLSRNSIYALWDDNDVMNDWAGQTVDRSRYEIGKQSFDEYMPIQDPWSASDPVCAGPTQFRVKHWGLNADIVILDTRSCRSIEAIKICYDPATKLPDIAPTLPGLIREKIGLKKDPPTGCLETIKDPSRTMLGPTQKSMFKNALLESKAKFKFVITSVNMQQTYGNPYDRWEGYDAERSEILNFIKDNLVKNVIFLSTDSHQNLMNEVFIDQFTASTPIAYEFVTGPVGALTEEKNLKALSTYYHHDFLADKKFALTKVVNADCGNLDKFSYGTVDITPNGLLKITLKEENKVPIADELHPGGSPCAKTFHP